jgi:DNA primase
MFANAPVPSNPLDAAPDQQSRLILVRALREVEDEHSDTGKTKLSMVEQVEGALATLQYKYLERRKRELVSLHAEATRRSDDGMALRLTIEMRDVDQLRRQIERLLRQLE